MARGLVRYQNSGDMHFVPFSCYRRQQYLGSLAARDLFEVSLEQMRVRYDFFVTGYVVMPEHVHLLVSEPKNAALSVAIQALKLSVAVQVGEGRFWQKRYYDFNVFTDKKMDEKLMYMHRNPYTRGLVAERDEWRWSSRHHWWPGARRRGDRIELERAQAWRTGNAVESQHRHRANPRLRSETWGTLSRGKVRSGPPADSKEVRRRRREAALRTGYRKGDRSNQRGWDEDRALDQHRQGAALYQHGQQTHRRQSPCGMVNMTSAELEFLKANVDKQVEVDTKGGECLRIKVLFVFDQESAPDVFFDVVPAENKLMPGGKPVGGYSLPLSDILSVRAVTLP